MLASFRIWEKEPAIFSKHACLLSWILYVFREIDLQFQLTIENSLAIWRMHRFGGQDGSVQQVSFVQNVVQNMGEPACNNNWRATSVHYLNSMSFIHFSFHLNSQRSLNNFYVNMEKSSPMEIFPPLLVWTNVCRTLWTWKTMVTYVYAAQKKDRNDANHWTSLERGMVNEIAWWC